jgi:hypothetical protein
MLSMATGMRCLTPILAQSTAQDWRLSYQSLVWTGVSPFSTQPPLDRVHILELDIDNNTFLGFDSIRNSFAQDDPARFEYCFDLSVVVSSTKSVIYLAKLKGDQGLYGGWPYHGNSNEPLPISAPLLLVTSDFDFK